MTDESRATSEARACLRVAKRAQGTLNLTHEKYAIGSKTVCLQTASLLESELAAAGAGDLIKNAVLSNVDSQIKSAIESGEKAVEAVKAVKEAKEAAEAVKAGKSYPNE